MSLWANFHPDLAPHVIGCPVPTMDHALLRSAQEFFQRTRAWRAWLEPVTTVANDKSYAMTLPTGSEVVRIERATLNGNPTGVLSHNEQSSNYELADQPESGLISRDRRAFFLSRALPGGDSLAVEVSLMPSLSATGIADDLFAQHAEAICFGAKHRLMAIPETGFFNGELSMANKSLFEAAINSVAVKSWRGFTGSTPRPSVNWC